MGKLLLSTAVGLVLAASMGAQAKTVHNAKHVVSTTVVAHAGKIPSLPSGEHKIKATALASGVLGTSGSGQRPVTSSTVTCAGGKKVTSCTLAMSAMIQFCNFNNTPSLQTAVTTLVDGTYVDFGPYAGLADYPCSTHNWQGIYSVGTGTHTVEYDAYSSGSSYIAQYATRSDVTTP